MEEGNEGKTNLWVKLGAAEIRYEGSETFLKDEVMPNVVERILEMVHDRAELQKPPPVVQIEAQKAPTQPAAPVASGTLQQRGDLTTNTIATILKAKTGNDLAIAAMAHVTIILGNATVERGVILKEMSGATGFYNENMRKNLSNILKALAKEDRLRLVGSATYSLSQKERQAIEQKLLEEG